MQIGELAAQVGLNPKTIRYYEAQTQRFYVQPQRSGMRRGVEAHCPSCSRLSHTMWAQCHIW